MKVLLVFGEEAKYHEINEGSSRAEIVQVFRAVFQYKRIDVLQENVSSSGQLSWVNCDQDFSLKKSNTELRMLKSIEMTLGIGNLSPSTCLVFCCDMQERFKPAIKYFDEIVAVGSRVVKAAGILGIPVLVTEQYPRGLGKTVSELNIEETSVVVEKTKFSMLVPDVESYLEKHPLATSIVIFGVEAHVCVQQTVLDLTKRGFDVHVVADATSSRSLSDRQLAFERLRRLGAFVTSCETVLLQWVADKQHEQFKPIQNIIKELPPDTGLLLKSSI